MAVSHVYAVPHPPLIIPSVGKGQEKKIQRTIDAYEKVATEIAEIGPDTVIIVTPHSALYKDYIHISPGKNASGDFHRFGSRVTLDTVYDHELALEIGRAADNEGIPAGPLGEKDKSLDHGFLVPFWFINRYCKSIKTVRISVSGLSYLQHYQFGKCIAGIADSLDRRAVLVASGDLSHRLLDEGPYSYAHEGPVFDEAITEALARADFLSMLSFDEGFCEAAGECGLRPFLVMAGCLDGKAVESELLSYEGPFGVGYSVSRFKVLTFDDSRHFDRIFLNGLKEEIEGIRKGEDEYVSLARASLESYILHKKKIRAVDLPASLTDQKAGVFVTLKKGGCLRGCIGTISATEDSVAMEIINNAISAGTGDPRFDPVTASELPDIIYSVDILGDPEPIASMDELSPDQYGVIVSKGARRGLLLPNLDGIKTPKQQVEVALQKAGIKVHENYKMERFRVVRHT